MSQRTRFVHMHAGKIEERICIGLGRNYRPASRCVKPVFPGLFWTGCLRFPKFGGFMAKKWDPYHAERVSSGSFAPRVQCKIISAPRTVSVALTRKPNDCSLATRLAWE